MKGGSCLKGPVTWRTFVERLMAVVILQVNWLMQSSMSEIEFILGFPGILLWMISPKDVQFVMLIFLAGAARLVLVLISKKTGLWSLERSLYEVASPADMFFKMPKSRVLQEGWL
ncbi:hypothetical protein AVEN_223681-1 [Araneus ventricosus]|uniref:Uncharacterized protein n=1 Tax=Araneus ventricosus TaxID=182803 RepID=A0A4Y2QRQ4_ARAVE|nr:hypothetical protein AVEN_223681-1 [Araneus ventricosus]